ncbi:MAG: helix-turn-helix transcriptional regulator [Deltaproteobacteria bacterium]|nr:helix-turn-helix transcriptional regulator [Deltaproteobacteria bacterium]
MTTSNDLEVKTQMEWQDYRRKLLRNPKVKEEYEKRQTERMLTHSIIEQRIRRNMTQEQLAQRVGTTRAVIARIENPAYGKASINMLKSIADALNCQLVVKLEPNELAREDFSQPLF